MTTATTIRRVEVRPPSARAELGNVIRFSMVIVIGGWMYLATDSATFRDTASTTRHLLPFQALIGAATLACALFLPTEGKLRELTRKPESPLETVPASPLTIEPQRRPA